MILNTLHNPAYAGVYVIGRVQTVRQIELSDPKASGSKSGAQGLAGVIEDHPTYSSFEKFLKNQELFGAASMRARESSKTGPLREGSALQQESLRTGLASYDC